MTNFCRSWKIGVKNIKYNNIMREYDSIFNKVPSGHGIAGGMCVPIGLIKYKGKQNNALFCYIFDKKKINKI